MEKELCKRKLRAFESPLSNWIQLLLVEFSKSVSKVVFGSNVMRFSGLRNSDWCLYSHNLFPVCALF